jgi:putative ABC transport system permease protein
MYSSTVTSSMSNMSSAFQPMLNNDEVLHDQYELLEGKWPENYDELIIILPSKNTISDLITYSLGFREVKELNDMVQAIFRGDAMEVKHKPLELTYDDLLNVKLKLILPYTLYKYNSKSFLSKYVFFFKAKNSFSFFNLQQ